MSVEDSFKKPLDDIKRVLVVGSWAKEQITIENIKKENVKVFSYMDTKNPMIIDLVDGYKIGDLSNIKDIVKYAKEKEIDIVFITTAEPLSLGIVDALEKEKINAFGPTKKAAKIESDKAYARNLMKKYKIEALPKFKTFNDQYKAINFAEKLGWEVAVKPIGLTEGLGVKVYGDQLETKDDVVEYIYQIFDNKIGGEKKVLIEEKICGKEFTIQCFVNGKNIISTPAIQDFKKKLSGDKGPNTASMGSYSDRGMILPFMDKLDYIKAINVMLKTLEAYNEETGENCKGFLYGQFMKTKDGIKLVEYNFRPGDPEWLNTMVVLEDSLLDIVKYLYENVSKPIHFEEKATVCKYIVPKNYPEKLNEILDIKFDINEIKKLGVNIYFSSGYDENNKLCVGHERGIAFVSKAESVEEASELVEKAIKKVKGAFHHRSDIGIEKKVKQE
jgi:phosphoribosylamine--glycine ligase